MDKAAVLKAVNFRQFYLEQVRDIQIKENGEAIGFCPFHDDQRTPNFHVNVGTGLFKCWRCGADGSVFDFVMKRDGVSFPEAVNQLGTQSGLSGESHNGSHPSKGRRIRRRFQYIDPQGRTAWKIRWDTDEPGKKCTWAQDPDGKQPGLKPCEPTLYELSKVRQATTVIECEGERDVDTVNGWLAELGRLGPTVATCTPYGAGDVKPEYVQDLFGKSAVYLSGDNDKAGPGYVQRHGAILAGQIADLRLLVVPEGAKDWSEWQESGAGTAEAFTRLIENADPWTALSISVQPDGDEQHGDEQQDDESADEPSSSLAFPEAAWRGPFAEYRAAMEGTSEAPDAAHFGALWAVAAARLRRRVSFYYAFTHYPNVYLIYYGTTGDSKTSASRQGLRLLPEDGRVKVLRGAGSAEALGDWMAQAEDGPAASHLLFIEELATLLTRGGWEGSTLLSFLTETFDAPDVYEVPFRKNPVKVIEPTPTLIAGTTPAWFWKGMREIDIHGGFGNRLFFLSGTPKAPIPLPAKPNPDALAAVRKALDGLDQIKSCELTLSPAAKEIWSGAKGFYMAWKRQQASWDELTAAAVKRIPAYIVKLAQVYSAFEGTVPLITKDQLLAAIEVGHYGALCAEQLMLRHRQHTVQGKCEARVLKVLEGEDLPPWKIHRRISGAFTAEELARAIRSLQGTGAVIEVAKTIKHEPILGRRGRQR